MKLRGFSMIGFGDGAPGGAVFHGIDPATGAQIDPAYQSATAADVDRAAELAARAAIDLRRASGPERAALLERIAANLETRVDALVERVMAETALPEARVRGETGRTCQQLRMFASLVTEGSWVEARIDRPDPLRKPLPKPDVRSMLRPLGPIAVFGASNFPLAFSVAGGDTASALAAGNPVIVKAHPAHPGTSEMVGEAIRDAVREAGFPQGTFSLLFDAGHEVGMALCQHPLVEAVGFTGSLRGGRALMDLVADRRSPIPVFAEMGSVNPIFVLPGAALARGDAIAAGLFASVTAGVGQFCTNPGLVVTGTGDVYDDFLASLTDRFATPTAATMLTGGICSAFHRGVQRLDAHPGVERLGGASTSESTGKGVLAAQAVPALFRTDSQTLLDDPSLMEEVFGPSTLVVGCAPEAEMIEVARSLEGQLSATIHGELDELATVVALAEVLEVKVGRLVFNGFPTGVEVGHAMVHGGPYPATSDGRSTSVGTRAISRFARPVCYQDTPDAALPDELKEGNPRSILRLVDGRPTTAAG